MAVIPQTGGGKGLDAWLTRMNDRHGPRYLAGGIAGIVFITLAYTTIGLACVSNYLGLSFGEFAFATGSIVVCDAFAIALGLLRHTSGLRLILRWLDGERSEELRTQAEYWAFEVPRSILRSIYVLLVFSAVPLGVVTLTGPADASPSNVVGVVIGAFTIWATAAVVSYACLEVVCSPIRRSIEHLELERRSGVSLVSILIALPVVLGFTMIGFASFLLVERGAPDAPSIPLVYLIALAMTLLGGAVVSAVLWVTARRPITDLVLGNRAVGQGSLDVRIPISTADELGELASSFNQMVEGLAERESLREEKLSLVEELQVSRTRIVAASDEARRRVERDLHDGAQQRLVLMNLKLNLLRRELEGRASLPMVEELTEDLTCALHELRGLARGIYPQVLTSDGVVAALESIAAEAPRPVHVSGDGIGRYPDEIEAAVYFCCLEALQNASKYAGESANVEVRLAAKNGELRFEVRDDGSGFDPAQANASSGLQNMSDRIGALGGTVRVDSEPGKGTRVGGAVPVGIGR